MKIHTKKLEAITIIVLEGDLTNDLATINQAIDKAEEGHENIIIDLSLTQSIAESELKILEEIQETSDLSEKSLVFCGVNSLLQTAFDEKFGEDFFNIVPTRNEAVDIVYMEEQERSFFN